MAYLSSKRSVWSSGIDSEEDMGMSACFRANGTFSEKLNDQA